MGQYCTHKVEQVQQAIQQHIYEPSVEQIKIQIGLMRIRNGDFRNNAHKYISDGTKQQYLGYMKDGVKQGYGQLKTSQERRYYGYFKDDLPNIKGVLMFSTDHYYIGQFQKGKMHGKGKETSPYFSFQGQYFNDSKKYGRLQAQQFTYEGSFQQGNNKFTGYGQLHYKERGQKYAGNFLEGQLDGQGIFYGSGNTLIYEGQFKHGLYDGHGKYYWQDGSWFQGNYKQGLKHGKGRYYREDSQVIQGVWQYGSIKSRTKDLSSNASTITLKNNRSNHSTKVEQLY